jgi:hypothetical protein
MELAVKYLVKARGEKDARIARSVISQQDQMLSFVRWGTPYGYDYAKIVRSLKPVHIKAMAKHIAKGTVIVQVYSEE